MIAVLPTLAVADAELSLSIETSQINGSTNLGNTLVEGVGEVSMIAHRNGNQLVIHAQNSEGKVIGKAETVVGLNDTPIYISTSEGLQKITIYWGKN